MPIAAEEGVFLDATSRAERGILTYGPSRAEIERARNEGRAPEERPREGRALEEALATIGRTTDALRSLARVAALTGLPEIGKNIASAEAVLRQGGVVHPFPVEPADAERAELDRHFGDWMAEAGERIGRAPVAERIALREELRDYAAEIARGLGDTCSAELIRMTPQTTLYGTVLQGEVLGSGGDRVALRPGAAERLRAEIVAGATALGLSGERIAWRLDAGAADAWEERDWVKADLLALAGRRRLDLSDTEQGRRLAKDLQGFYDRSAAAIDEAREHETLPENDRPVRTLRAMARIMAAEGRVEFRDDDQAERFAKELRVRYGEGIVQELAAGRTEALARDVEDETERFRIARAVVAAAKVHTTIGLTLREAARADRELGGQQETEGKRDRER